MKAQQCLPGFPYAEGLPDVSCEAALSLVQPAFLGRPPPPPPAPATPDGLGLPYGAFCLLTVAEMTGTGFLETRRS